jgi:hypothetical protein
VEFAASSPFDAVIEAVDFLKDAFEKGRTLSQSPAHAFPMRFIPDNQRRYIFTQYNSTEERGQKNRHYRE